MIALISDLHFCDGTATPGNVAPQVFELALGEIYGVAARVARARDRPVHLDVVLLGDIFDLLRTERWFEDAGGNAVPLVERPWGTAAALDGGGVTPAVAVRARGILDEILSINAGALATIRGERMPPPPGVLVRRIYIPGNHDRLYLHDADLRAGMLGGLGAVDGEGLSGEGIFLHRLERPDHAVIARHGHEWDMWSFPGYRPDTVPSEYTDLDYRATPIGDALATELAVRLPHELRARLLDATGFTPELAARIHRRMMRIEDVRPIFAAFHWAFCEVSRIGAELDREQARVLSAAHGDALRSLARHFRDLDFYQAWHERRLLSCHPAPALLLRLVLAGLSAPAWLPVEWIAERIEAVLARWSPRAVTRAGAVYEDLARVGSADMRFVVYGHTHHAERVPLRGGARVEDVYFNTGTYRPGVFRADDGHGFVGWQRVAYTCIASAEEAALMETPFGLPNHGPAFVAWSGACSAGELAPTSSSTIR